MAFNALFGLFSKGASKLREVLLQVLTFNIHKGEGFLPAAERFNRFVENAQMMQAVKVENLEFSQFFSTPC